MPRTVCSSCHLGCGLVVKVENGIVKKVTGDSDHPANKGWICLKGRAAPDIIYAEDRLKTPLLRKNGELTSVDCETSIKFAAERLLAIREQHGPNSLVVYKGAPFTEEVEDAFTLFLAAYGSARLSEPGHLCHYPTTVGFNSMFGGWMDPDYDHTRCIMVWGAGVFESMRVSGRVAYDTTPPAIFKKARERGVKLIVIDPRKTQLASRADLWLPVKPGKDKVLALGMIRHIIVDELFDNEFVKKYVVGFEELVKQADSLTPEACEDITGVAKRDMKDAAETYATTKPSCIRLGNGLEMHSDVFQTTRAIASLIAITSQADIKGGNVAFPAPQVQQMPFPNVTLSEGRKHHPLVPYEPLPDIIDEILSNNPDRPRAMIIHHANPLVTLAESDRVRKALKQLDFLMVYGIFPNASTDIADLVLPDCSDFERTGIRFSRSPHGALISLRRKVIEPLYDSKPVMNFEYQLARAMGLDEVYPWKNQEEWVNYRLKASGISIGDFGDSSFKFVSPPVSYRKHEKRGFPTPSGRVEVFSQRLSELGLEPVPKLLEQDRHYVTDSHHPLTGVTRKPLCYTHSRFRNIPSLRKVLPSLQVMINPLDAGARRIASGSEVLVRSSKSVIKGKAKVSSNVQAGVVVVDFGWGNGDTWDQNVNRLVPDTPRDPATASTNNHEFACEVSRC